jgi:hypothetical protein
MPGRVDVRAGMSYGRYLLERGSFASGGEKILLLRLEGSFDSNESPALVRKIADARFPGLVRPIGDDADAEVYHPRKKRKAVRLGTVLVGFLRTHLRSPFSEEARYTLTSSASGCF